MTTQAEEKETEELLEICFNKCTEKFSLYCLAMCPVHMFEDCDEEDIEEMKKGVT